MSQLPFEGIRIIELSKTLAAQIDDGAARFEGDLGVLEQLGSAMVDFEIGFEILPGTKGPAADAERNPFEVGPVSVASE